MGEFYGKLKSTKITAKKEIEEAVFVEPLDSYETIISSVNHALEDDEDISMMCKEEMDDMMESMIKECADCGMPAPNEKQVPIVYPILIATFPNFCIFEISDDTYRCDYTYDRATKRVELGEPVEIVMDVTVSDKPEDDSEE